MRTDTERLDWLEAEGNGCALVHDDDAHWAVAFSGTQNVIINGPQDLTTTYWIEADKFRPTVREAIDAAMAEQTA
jgi:hypothetical protein